MNKPKLYDLSKYDVLTDDFGATWIVHKSTVCKGGRCVLHNPTRHSMEHLPIYVRETGLIERICPHGVGHPDPDSAAYMNSVSDGGWGVHGCCSEGCCRKKGSTGA